MRFFVFLILVSKKRIFFSFPLHFLARICAHLRAHIISLFFLRARAHAREKVTRIAIIDRPLSMIVGGRVGALFFIVCFLFYYIDTNRFLYLSSRMADE